MLPRVNVIKGENAEYMLFPNDFIAREINRDGVYCFIEQVIAKVFAAAVDVPVIFDIGANCGSFTVPMAKEIAPKMGWFIVSSLSALFTTSYAGIFS